MHTTSSSRWWRLLLAALGMLLLAPRSAHAFDYLEHSYFTDHACHYTQRMLREQLRARPDDTRLAARYIALGVFCPETPTETYCSDGVKQAKAHINLLEDGPSRRALSLTLGDFAALPDHFARFGPVRHMERAGTDGVWRWTARWLGQDAGYGVGGVVEDIAEDACETDDLPDWSAIARDISAYMERARTTQRPVDTPRAWMSPIARVTPPRGPTDPAGLYSFDNPHYFDLVLRSHHHFGEYAYGAWLGYHSAGVQIAGRRCEESLALDARTLRRLGKSIPGFEDIDWDALTAAEYARRGCALLGWVIERRVQRWTADAAPSITQPVARHLATLLELPSATASEDTEKTEEAAAPPPPNAADAIAAAKLRTQITEAVMGLVFEGAALHFLQDGLASGHMRTIRTRGGLKEARYDHDLDNRSGVVALLRTRAGAFPMVAFGDSYMLGPPPAPGYACDLDAVGTRTPAQVTACLLKVQRGVLTAATVASLTDWALGGTLYGVRNEGEPCAEVDGAERFVCAHLPAGAIEVAGLEHAPAQVPVMQYGSLPVPPPPFSYESLAIRIGFDVSGRAPQINFGFALLQELDDLANWMTSYRFGISASLGEGVDEQWFADFGYRFHWRWTARFLIDGGALAYAGFRDFDQKTTFFGGVSPMIGITVLPEGWIKIPLEISISYRFPVNLFASDGGFLADPILEGHWIYVGLGLAFMN